MEKPGNALQQNLSVLLLQTFSHQPGELTRRGFMQVEEPENHAMEVCGQARPSDPLGEGAQKLL
jgi:hypothetical protein